MDQPIPEGSTRFGGTGRGFIILSASRLEHLAILSRKMRHRLLGLFFGMLSLVSMTFVYLASQDNIASLSPQGCRMSWMSPSYILQSDFDEHWTPLSRRYSLWLYREVEWDTVTKACEY